MSADYSQIELRVIATYRETSDMIDAFVSDVDIHQASREDFITRASRVSP